MFDSPVDLSNGYHIAMVFIGLAAILILAIAQHIDAEKNKRKNSRMFDKGTIKKMTRAISEGVGETERRQSPETERLVSILELQLKVSANSLMANNRFSIARGVNINYRQLAIEILKVSIHSFKISREQIVNASDSQISYQIVVALSYFARSKKGSSFSKNTHAESILDISSVEMEQSLALQRISYLTATRMIGLVDISRADKSRVTLSTIKENLTLFVQNSKGMKYY